MAEQGVEGKDGTPLNPPEIDIPEGMERYWTIFWDVSNSITRVLDGVARRIPPSEWFYWSKISETSFNSVEYALLRDMDGAFCHQMNLELAAYQAEKIEASKQR